PDHDRNRGAHRQKDRDELHHLRMRLAEGGDAPREAGEMARGRDHARRERAADRVLQRLDRLSELSEGERAALLKFAEGAVGRARRILHALHRFLELVEMLQQQRDSRAGARAERLLEHRGDFLVLADVAELRLNALQGPEQVDSLPVRTGEDFEAEFLRRLRKLRDDLEEAFAGGLAGEAARAERRQRAHQLVEIDTEAERRRRRLFHREREVSQVRELELSLQRRHLVRQHLRVLNRRFRRIAEIQYQRRQRAGRISEVPGSAACELRRRHRNRHRLLNRKKTRYALVERFGELIEAIAGFDRLLFDELFRLGELRFLVRDIAERGGQARDVILKILEACDGVRQWQGDRRAERAGADANE